MAGDEDLRDRVTTLETRVDGADQRATAMRHDIEMLTADVKVLSDVAGKMREIQAATAVHLENQAHDLKEIKAMAFAATPPDVAKQQRRDAWVIGTLSTIAVGLLAALAAAHS